MGKQAGIDDSGDPLWASLIQNRVRDNTAILQKKSALQLSQQSSKSPSVKSGS